MIFQLKPEAYSSASELADTLEAIVLDHDGKRWLLCASSLKEVPISLKPFIEQSIVCESDIQLASLVFSAKRSIDLGFDMIGGNSGNCVMMAGPCSVESEAQIHAVAALCIEQGIKVLRAGCFKPRTSPYSFQGMGLEGLKLLAKIRDEYRLKIITEIRDSTHADLVIDYADIVQIGAKCMYDQGVLRKCGAVKKPVLLKRGFGSSLQEFVQSAEFILSSGNPNVMLCERGIRTFETKTRFTLDLCGVAWLQQYTNLPVILDPSHAMGYAYGVPSLSRACIAMGVDGLLIEVHPNPKQAKSDASQQLDFNTFRSLNSDCRKLANSLSFQMI